MNGFYSRIVKGLLLFFGLFIIGYGVLLIFSKPAEKHPFFSHINHRPLVFAHRGGAGLWPEETMYAFKQAEAMGVDVLEMDMHATADRDLVLIHDSTVDRTTNGKGQVNSYTLEELKNLDAGYKWSPDDGQTFPYRGLGIKIPSLEEVLINLSDMLINIEIKQKDSALGVRLCKLIKDYEMEQQVMVASAHEKVIQSFRRECPQVATAAIQNEAIKFFIMNLLGLSAGYTPHENAMQVPEYIYGLHVVTNRFVDAAHKINLEVHVWTVNEESDMQRMLNS